MKRDRIFMYVTYDRLRDWLLCGWMVAIPNAPAHHHHYGQIVEWLCDCKMARPR
jgi:hypothetical protein